MIFKISKVLLIIVLSVAVFYLLPSSPPYPKPPSDSVQSLEEADVEDAQERRAYFTNFSRGEILNHYKSELNKGLPFAFSYVVTYPPEDAQTLIRDQTRSVHLPEIINPGRESIFVNFFEASSPKDEIWYKGVHYERKITVRYVSTPAFPRILILVPAFAMLFYLVKQVLVDVIKSTRLVVRKQYE